MKTTYHSDIYLSPGNLKVACPTWSLPHGKTCKPCTECREYCYAKKAEQQYPHVLPRREKNYEASLSPSFVDQMVALVSNLTGPHHDTIRLHESGDFYSREYIIKWYQICSRRYNCNQFYAYTKREDLFTPDLLKGKPDNLTLIYSWDCVKNGWWWNGDLHVSSFFGKQDALMIERGFDNVLYVTEEQSNCPHQQRSHIQCVRDCRKCIEDHSEPIIIRKH